MIPDLHGPFGAGFFMKDPPFETFFSNIPRFHFPSFFEIPGLAGQEFRKKRENAGLASRISNKVERKGRDRM